MDKPNIEEEKQEINSINSPGLQEQQKGQKEISKKYFSRKCKWISFSVSFFVLAVKKVALLLHSKSSKENASSLLMLTSLKIRTFHQNSDGSREYNEMVDQNTEIEQQIQKQLRILQQNKSAGNSSFCEEIPAEQCGNVNKVPLVTVITDQQTGAVQQIGIPSQIPDLMIQPLVSNIIHVAPNLAESTSNPGTDGNRLLREDYTNVYYIGKEAFIPQSTKTKQWFGNTVIKKTISQSDQIDGNSKGINLFDFFEQSQETNLDNNNYLKTSHITTNSKFSNSLQNNDVNQNTDNLTDKQETEITNDSNLVTLETKSDEDLTNVLTEIQNKQTIQYYSMQDLQDKIQSQQDQTQDLVQDQGGYRLLSEEERGDFQSVSQSEQVSQQGECNSNIFNQKRTIKEVTVFKYKIGLQAEFKGDIKDGSASGHLKSCISLNSNCALDLVKEDFNYKGKPLESYEKKESKSNPIFSTIILIMGYPVTIGADLNYSWDFIHSPIKTESDLGISEYLYASLSVTAYGEVNIVYVINIKAGVEGYIFKGSTNGAVQFRTNKTDNSIIPNKYLVFLDIQIESLTFDLFAQYKGVTIEFKKKCIRIFRKKICWYFPIYGWTDWIDIYRKNFLSIGNLKEKNRIFQLISKCY